MEEQCCRLESDNQSLLCKLREQEQAASHVADKRHVQDDNRSEVTGLRGELKTSELEVSCWTSCGAQWGDDDDDYDDGGGDDDDDDGCLLYTSPSPRDRHRSRMPSSA